MSVDVDIYMNNIIKFFRDNPNDLLNLIPKEKEKEFYEKIREIASKNSDTRTEVGLTKQQMIDICKELNEKNTEKTKYEKLFVQTKFGDFCLN